VIVANQQDPHDLVLEVCVDSVESAIAAQSGGAARVELCANLEDGGITPSAGMIESVRKRISIGLHALIRPRPGDFCYSEAEYEVMRNDIKQAKALGIDGVALGILHEDHSVDTNRMRRLIEAARPLSVTFHRAFDVATDPFQALEDIVAAGVDRILTSGQQETAAEGLACIAQLVDSARHRLIIMAGSGINEHNIKKIVMQSGVREVHVGGAVRTANADHPAAKDFFSNNRATTDAHKVRQLLKAAL